MQSSPLYARQSCHATRVPCRHAARSQWQPAATYRLSRCQQRQKRLQRQHIALAQQEGQAEQNKEEQRLQADFGELYERIEDLAGQVGSQLQGTSIYLIGMMGSGKSTVGGLLGKALQYPMLDTDALIEQSTSQAVSQIFAEEGEKAFRDMETDVLKELMPYARCVVATGGGAVLRRSNWGYMQHAVVVWLDGSPELLAARVVGDGVQKRPLVSLHTYDADREAAEQEASEEYERTLTRLRGILEERHDKYAIADLRVSIQESQSSPSGLPSAVVAYRVLKALQRKLDESAKERETRKNFEIKGADDVPKTLRVQQNTPVHSEE